MQTSTTANHSRLQGCSGSGAGEGEIYTEKGSWGELDELWLPSNSKVIYILVGLILSTFFAGMDSTLLVSTINPITSEFRSFDYITLLCASYFLIATTFLLLHLKMAYLFGKKNDILFVLICFLSGSVFTGASTSIVMLVVSRSISGLGTISLASLSIAIVPDLAPMNLRNTYIKSITAAQILGSAIGPIIGGIISEYLQWRWAFYVNVPVTFSTIIIILIYLKLPSNFASLSYKLQKINLIGGILLFVLMLLLVLASHFGGYLYEMKIIPVLVLAFLIVIFLLAFVVLELKFTKEPIIPYKLFIRNRNVVSASVTAFFNGFSIVITIIYLPAYLQTVYSMSVASASYHICVMIAATTLVALPSHLLHINPRICYAFNILGTSIALVGAILMCLMHYDFSFVEIMTYPAIIAAGFALSHRTSLLIAQSSVLKEDVPSVITLISFAQLMGYFSSICILSCVFVNVFYAGFKPELIGIDIKDVSHSIAAIQSLDPFTFQIAVKSIKFAIKTIYTVLIPFAVIALISTFFIKSPLIKSSSTQATVRV